MDDEIDAEKMKEIPYLEAVINEALRLWGVTPGGVQAVLSEEGVLIGGIYIPPYTEVRYPSLALMSDERYFVHGKRFIPERWTDQPELVKDRRAFVPFSL